MGLGAGSESGAGTEMGTELEAGKGTGTGTGTERERERERGWRRTETCFSIHLESPRHKRTSSALDSTNSLSRALIFGIIREIRSSTALSV